MLNIENIEKQVVSELSLTLSQINASGKMALRFLFYVGELLKNELGEQTLYTSRRIKFSGPVFVVFYNGVEERPEQWIEKLSDSFDQKTDLPKLELEVLVLNVNFGHNKELMEQCQTLKEYSIYVAKVRTYAETMSIDKAVERAIEECIKEGVLTDFLGKHRSEAVRMSILEFDEEREMKLIRKAEFEDGFAGGELNLLVSLIRKQLRKGKNTEEIAEILDLDFDRVGQVVGYITQNPVLDDREIATKIALCTVPDPMNIR